MSELRRPGADQVYQLAGKLRAMDPSANFYVDEERLRGASELVIFGPTVGRYLDVILDPLNPAESFSAVGKVDATVIGDAVNTLAFAALRTEEEYASRRPGILQDPTFLAAIARHNANVAEGVIDLLPEEFAMTAIEGEAQVRFADAVFSNVDDPRVQLYLAGVNYAAFTPKTMQTGRTLLDNPDRRSLAQWSEHSAHQEGMPHLAFSNIGIGEVVADISRYASQKGIPLQTIDLGSGSGATLGGIVLGLSDRLEKGDILDPGKLVIVGVEGTVPLFEQMRDDFAPAAVRRLALTGNSGVTLGLTARDFHEPPTANYGELTLINGDIASTLEALEFPAGKDGITAVTANYSWHRLSSQAKDRIIRTMTEKNENVIFIIADLVRNGSEVNRRYFNFRDNGLLNCGNIGLGALFDRYGLAHFELNENTAPRSMNQALATRLGNGVTSDAIFTIAYAGQEAQDIVGQWGK